MKTWKISVTQAIAVLICGAVTGLAQMPSLDDFVAPASQEPDKGIVAPTEVSQPDAVKVTEEKVTKDGKKTPVVEAASTQDAIIASVQKLHTMKQDVVEIKVGSGRGVVARGLAGYEVYKNPNATLLDKRLAYAKAYAIAKKNLAEHLYGLTVEAEQFFAEAVDAYDTEKVSLANTADVASDSGRQKIEGMIRGYAVYEVSDNVKDNTVEVSIVTTPKTRGETMRVTPGTILATDFRSGMKDVFAELNAGIVPPTGGRIITVSQDDETQFYFIGFGSAINRANKNPAVERKLRVQAADMAARRAAASLCALIIGDQVMWESGYTENTDSRNAQFAEVVKTDATIGESETLMEPLEKTRTSFLSRMEKRDSYKFAQKGKLPPGLQAVRWVSEDGDWSFAAYIYNPFSTAVAEAIQHKMENEPGILDRGKVMGERKPSESGSKNEFDRAALEDDVRRTKRDVGQGPTGKVVNDDDL